MLYVPGDFAAAIGAFAEKGNAAFVGFAAIIEHGCVGSARYAPHIFKNVFQIPTRYFLKPGLDFGRTPRKIEMKYRKGDYFFHVNFRP